jgi:hypothetical protein
MSFVEFDMQCASATSLLNHQIWLVSDLSVQVVLAKVEESHGSCAWWWRSIAAVRYRLTNHRIAFEDQEQ